MGQYINDEFNKFLSDIDTLEIENYISIIEGLTDNKQKQKYIDILLNKYNYTYLEDKFSEEIEDLNNSIGNLYNTNTTTSKGLDINIIFEPIINLFGQYKCYVIYNDYEVGSIIFELNFSDKTLQLGKVINYNEYTQMGVDAEIINIIQDISQDYDLDIIVNNKSMRAQNF